MKLSRIVSAAVLTATLGLAVCAQAVDKETGLYYFNLNSGGVNTSGYFPHGRFIADQAGNLYGATLSGAFGNGGTIFELTPNTSGGWNFNILFTCNTVCNNPLGSLVMDGAGNLYGSTGLGNVFELSPNGSGGWTATVVYSFTGGTNGYDGYAPNPGLILDGAGNLYGTNFDGGINNQGYVFELSPASGGGWSLTHLHDFTGSDGAVPYATVIMDQAGNLYGTTNQGGSSTQCSSGCGVVFELSNGSGVWTETIPHSFNGKDGSNLQGPLFMDAAGNLYGTAASGGVRNFGVVFEMSLVSGAWKTRALYSFISGNTDGAFPNAALAMDPAGNLYSTTYSGGGGDCNFGSDVGCGTAFELSSSGGRWKESVLHDFSGGADGGFPQGLIFGAGGNLYGVTASGGNIGGLAFELSPSAPLGQ